MSSSAAWLKSVMWPDASTATRASPMPATTASRRLRRRVSSSAASRSADGLLLDRLGHGVEGDGQRPDLVLALDAGPHRQVALLQPLGGVR